MKTPIFKILAIALTLTITSCKKDVTLAEFKYADKGIVVDCDKFDLKLLNEALFSFENDILKAYGNNKTDLSRPYSQYIRGGVYNSIKHDNIASQQSINIAKVLKTKTDLWDNDKLNYNSKLFKCLKDKIKSNDLKRTINALTETNTMSKKVFGPAVLSSYRSAVTDKYLAAYIALDFFYPNLFDLKEENTEANKTEEAK